MARQNIDNGDTGLVARTKINENDTELYNAVDNLLEQKIHIPTTQPIVVTGTPNILTLDMLSNRQAIFEPRLSTPVLTINIDFDWVISNKTNALLMDATLQLTGTRIITLESDVLLSNASSIGAWNAGTKKLTLSAGTDDLIEFNLLRYSTSSKWLLMVGEVAT